METNPKTWIAALRNSQDRLSTLVRPLSPEQLQAQSYDTEWRIAQVLSHLGSQAELFSAWLTAALERTDPPDREAMQQVWDAWDARDPEAQVADSLEYNERLVQRLEALTNEQLSTMHLSLFGMELDGADLTRMRLTEHAIHTWDIAVSLDPAATIAAETVSLIIDTLDQVAARAGKPQGEKVALRVITTAPERRLMLQVADGVTISEREDGTVDGGLRIPAEGFVRLVYGRLDPEHTPEVEITAPDVSLDDLRRVFPGF